MKKPTLPAVRGNKVLNKNGSEDKQSEIFYKFPGQAPKKTPPKKVSASGEVNQLQLPQIINGIKR